MIKKMLAFVIYGSGISILVFLKLFLINVFPFIFGYIDIAMLFFVIAIMRGIGGGIVWFAFCAYMLLDMLTAHAFGIELVAGVMSVLGVYWFFEDVFTNLSIWTAGILTIFGMLVFRILYVALGLLFSTLSESYAFTLSWGLLKDAGLEIVGTAVVSIPLYAIVIKVVNTWTKERIRYS